MKNDCFMNTEKDVIEFINNLEGYQGYVQFSHRKIDIDKDVFINKQPHISKEAGFIYEAHFTNEKESICIKQKNECWICSKSDISEIDDKDKNTFKGIGSLKVRMAQIWETEKDNLCENFKVKKLKAVVFAGFNGGDK